MEKPEEAVEAFCRTLLVLCAPDDKCCGDGNSPEIMYDNS